jgi:drug/metabolite transporter (DMT)-like permease
MNGPEGSDLLPENKSEECLDDVDPEVAARLTPQSATREGLGDRAKGYLFIASAALCWGISASLGRAVFTGRLKFGGQVVGFIPPLALTQSRTTISFLVLLPLLLAFKGRRGVAMRLPDLLRCMLLGIFGVAASNFFYYLAIQKTTVATAIILQYTAPIFVLLYMLMRGRQRATAARLCGVCMAVVGSMLAIGVVGYSRLFPWLFLSTRQLKFGTLGVLSALIAAVAFSFWNIYSGPLIAASDRWRVVLWAMFGAGASWLLINPPTRIVAAHYQPQQWIFMFAFAICSLLVPFTLYLWGLEFLDPTRAVVTASLEPVFAIVIAAVALGEVVGPVQIAGIGVTLLATVLVQLPEKGHRATAVPPID